MMSIVALSLLHLHVQVDSTASKADVDEVCMLQTTTHQNFKSETSFPEQLQRTDGQQNAPQQLPKRASLLDVSRHGDFDATHDPSFIPVLIQMQSRVSSMMSLMSRDDEPTDAVSTTLKCILNLSLQYFAVYTALTVVRAWNRVKGSGPGFFENTLTSATSTVAYAPMLAVLFIGTRMRAIQLAQGDTEKYGLPPWWAQIMMHVCALAVLGQLLFVVAVAAVTDAAPETDEDGNVKPPEEGIDLDTACVGWFFEAIRYLLMLGMYGGCGVVCVSLFVMQAPKELYPDGTPPVSPAVSCVMNLTIQYFIVYFLLAACRTADKIFDRSESKATKVMQLAADTVSFAPMLCILFLAARMRALQIDPETGNPQAWAQACFYLCTYSVLLQTVLVVCVPYLAGGEPTTGSTEGDVSFEVKSPALSTTLTVIRSGAMLCLYGGFTVVIVSVFLIKNEENPDLTPPISTTMQCVINLTVQFFALYLCHWLFTTFRQMSGSTAAQGGILEMLVSARQTVAFSPMLCALFVATRMRALQLTDNKGAPQGWVQDCMQVASWSVLAQLLVTIACYFVSDKAKQSTIYKQQVSGILESVRLFFVSVMLSAALVVAYGAVMMTAETATGKNGLLPSVSG
jgi:hypothetical protein